MVKADWGKRVRDGQAGRQAGGRWRPKAINPFCRQNKRGGKEGGKCWMGSVGWWEERDAVSQLSYIADCRLLWWK